MNDRCSVENAPVKSKFLGKGTLIFLLAFISLLAWSISTPVGGTPDEDFHLASIWCGQGTREAICESGSKLEERLVPQDLVFSAACYAFDPEKSADCQRSGFGTGSELIPTTRGNFNGLYPPVFYWVMSWFVSDDVNSSVFGMRAFNTLIFLLTLSASVIFLRGRQIAPPKVALFTLIPLGVFLIPSINPSSWAISACIGAYFATSAWLKQKGKTKIFALTVTALMVLMAAGSRADAAVFVIISIASAFAIHASVIQLRKISTYLPLAISILFTALLVSATGQVNVGANGLEGDAKSSIQGITLLIVNFIQAPELWAGVFGYWGLGWLDTPMPTMVWVLGLLMFGYLVFSGFLTPDRRKKFTLLALLFALWVIPVVILTRSGLTVGAGVQPRYLLPLIAVAASVAIEPIQNVAQGISAKFQTNIFRVFLFFTFTIALFINFRRYESGIDVMNPNLFIQNDWAWPSAPPPMIIWVMASLCFAATLYLLPFDDNTSLKKKSIKMD